jgi:hypothetical protein
MSISSLTGNKRRTTRQAVVLLALIGTLVVLLSACSGTAAPAPPLNLQGSAGNTSGDIASTATPVPTTTSTPAPTDTEVTVSFSNDVLPILQSRCVNCHGGQKTEKELNVTSYENLMAGSEKGAVVIPGDADNSSFIELVLQNKMPKRGPKLLPDQVQILVDWVEAGALNN